MLNSNRSPSMPQRDEAAATTAAVTITPESPKTTLDLLSDHGASLPQSAVSAPVTSTFEQTPAVFFLFNQDNVHVVAEAGRHGGRPRLAHVLGAHVDQDAEAVLDLRAQPAGVERHRLLGVVPCRLQARSHCPVSCTRRTPGPSRGVPSRGVPPPSESRATCQQCWSAASLRSMCGRGPCGLVEPLEGGLRRRQVLGRRCWSGLRRRRQQVQQRLHNGDRGGSHEAFWGRLRRRRRALHVDADQCAVAKTAAGCRTSCSSLALPAAAPEKQRGPEALPSQGRAAPCAPRCCLHVVVSRPRPGVQLPLRGTIAHRPQSAK
mmetsp:Transcript_27391/g.56900  ORF Transcript_27391/g.56900 Transcript_27391/m.56900 type:complete len:319 (-) Transcript_27391:84-1040(-)